MNKTAKKVCLVTFFGDNYGGCLQAFATQNYLEKLGVDVQILNYIYIKKRTIKWFINKIKGCRPFKSYLKRRKIMHAYLKNQNERHLAFEDFRKKYLHLTSKVFYSVNDLYHEKLNFDLYLAGSDQIWNPTFYGCCNPIYYLSFVEANKIKGAYASSIGLSVMPKQYCKDFKKYINQLDFVSVRELQGSKLIKDIAGRSANVVLDPTFLLYPDDYEKLDSKVNLNAGKYIFCYLFSDFDYFVEVKEYAKNILGLKIISFPYTVRELAGDDEKIFDATPADFVKMIKNAALVITDSFHATALSINHQTPFLTLARQLDSDVKNMNSRIYSLLAMFDLTDRLINRNNYKQKIENYKIDFKKSATILEQKRLEAKEFLSKWVIGNVDM